MGHEQNSDFSATYYRRCRGLDGGVHAVDVYRRNRQVVARFPFEVWVSNLDASPEPLAPSPRFLNKICHDLTPRQRRVFLTCLETPSYSEAARRLGISHVAVIDFLKRMSSRNEFVRTFQETRQRQHL
jgi:DNA-binding CsgD family transcriptional regulator